MKLAPAIVVLGVALCATAAYAQPRGQSGQTDQTGQTGQTDQAAAPAQRRPMIDPNDPVVDGPWALRISGFEGFDGGNSQQFQAANEVKTTDGAHSGESVRLSLRRGGRRTFFSFDGSNTLIYYPGDSSLLSDIEVGAAQNFQIRRNTTLAVGETANRSPYYNVGAFPGIGNYSGTDLSRTTAPALVTGGQTTGTYGYSFDTKLAHVIDPRNTVAATYNLRGIGINGVNSHSVMHEVGGRYSHLINRTVGYHLGYGFGNAHFGGVSPTVLHNIDVGIDLQKSLSLTRRTTFSFTTGTTFIKATPVNSNVNVGATKEFNFLGHASLTHFIGQTWSVAATYDRGLQMLDAVLVPYFVDGVTAAVGGNLGRRSSLALSSSWISGAPLGINSATKDRALIESVWFQHSLNRRLVAYAQYTLYGQHFTPASVSAIDLPQRFNRNTARVGLTLTMSSSRALQKQPVR